MPGSDELLPMGVVERPHGIKGEFGADWWGDYAPTARDALVLHLPEGDKRFTVRSIRWHKERPLISLVGIEDRTSAEALKGATILIPRNLLPPLDQDEAYLADLPGCLVLLPNGEKLGTLDHFEFPAGREIWVIRDGNGNEILFPAQESFISSIDAENRKIVIDPPPGLVEIYRA